MSLVKPFGASYPLARQNYPLKGVTFGMGLARATVDRYPGHMTITEALDQMYARLDEDNRALNLMTVEPYDPDAYDRWIPEQYVAPECEHPDCWYDSFDDVLRCLDCDGVI